LHRLLVHADDRAAWAGPTFHRPPIFFGGD
jgi:hypothetical protein